MDLGCKTIDAVDSSAQERRPSHAGAVAIRSPSLSGVPLEKRNRLRGKEAASFESTAADGAGQALGLGEQLSRDARTRVIAAAAVVMVHSAYPPGHPLLAVQPSGLAAAEVLAFHLIVTFPVNAFVLLSFLNLAPRLRPDVPARQRMRTLANRLLPGYLFWSAVFLAARAVAEWRLPSPGRILEGIVFGSAAAHLYFIPLLFALTAAAALLLPLAKTSLRALLGGGALGLLGLTLHVRVGGSNPAMHALIGSLGFSPFAVAGLFLSRRWRGLTPGRNSHVLTFALAVAAASAALLVRVALSAGTQPLPVCASSWLAVNGYALGVPLLLLSVRGPASTRMVSLARCSLGVYMIHPLFIQALRFAEAHTNVLAGKELMLILPNALVAAALSVGAVEALWRTRLRRLVA